MNKETKKIVESIKFLLYGPHKDVKPYEDEMRNNPMGCKLNGFIFQRDVYCWLIWKPTDIRTHPEWKGECLLKTMPYNVPVDKMESVIDSEFWNYL